VHPDEAPAAKRTEGREEPTAPPAKRARMEAPAAPQILFLASSGEEMVMLSKGEYEKLKAAAAAALAGPPSPADTLDAADEEPVTFRVTATGLDGGAFDRFE
jgi:hypothetical protein